VLVLQRLARSVKFIMLSHQLSKLCQQVVILSSMASYVLLTSLQTHTPSPPPSRRLSHRYPCILKRDIVAWCCSEWNKISNKITKFLIEPIAKSYTCLDHDTATVLILWCDFQTVFNISFFPGIYKKTDFANWKWSNYRWHWESQKKAGIVSYMATAALV